MPLEHEILRTQNLVCGHHGKPVVGLGELTAAPSQITVLFGANGSGKSTLLNTLAGLLPPLQGSVTVNGKDLSSLSPAERARHIAVVPQSEYSVFGYTAWDIAAMARFTHSRTLFETAEDRVVIKRSLETLQIAHLADRIFSELSGGEQQKVLIARALAQESPIIVFDEPTAHLDPLARLEAADLIKRLALEFDRTILAAVHDIEWGLHLAGQAVVLYAGDAAVMHVSNEDEMLGRLSTAYGLRIRRASAEDLQTPLVLERVITTTEN